MDIENYRLYLTAEKCMAERSVKDYILVAQELSKRFDLVGPLTYKQVNDAIRDMKAALNWSQATVYKYSICVRHLFRWLTREGYRVDNPYPFSEWRKARPKTPKFLTPEQFNALVDDPHLTHQELTLLWLLWDSGARISEITALEQGNLDLVRGLVNIPYEISKGSYSYRNVPISQNAIERLNMQVAFARRRGHEKAIFLGADNQPATTTGLQKVLHNIGMRSSPLRDQMHISAHMFRHSFGIRMLENGVPQIIVQKWLGHQSLTMTSHYISMTSDSSRRIYEQYVTA